MPVTVKAHMRKTRKGMVRVESHSRNIPFAAYRHDVSGALNAIVEHDPSIKKDKFMKLAKDWARDIGVKQSRMRRIANSVWRDSMGFREDD